eukprot:Skav205304  [mRNA]  locus=scaffold3444:19613:21087:+ [translate_table: standard]
MCYGNAKPIFMSDAPGFLQRQRARAAKHLVSEHAGTITCRCQKCDSNGFLTTSLQARIPGRVKEKAAARPQEKEAKEATVQRDFTWLLRVMSEIAPSEGGGLAGTLSYDGIWTPDPRSLQGKLGILVPETVVLEKGKPKRQSQRWTPGTGKDGNNELIRGSYEFLSSSYCGPLGRPSEQKKCPHQDARTKCCQQTYV